MELGDHCGSDDLYVNDERIPVSREVFQAVCKENNHIRYLALRKALYAGSVFSVSWRLPSVPLASERDF